jgi:hypothetical protein
MPNASSVTTKHTDHHDLIVWDDQTLTIDHHQYQERQDNTLDHAHLTCNEARALRNLLNSEVVMRALGLL